MVEVALGEAEEAAVADEAAEFEGWIEGGSEGAAEDEVVGYLLFGLVVAVAVVVGGGGRVDDAVEYLF